MRELQFKEPGAMLREEEARLMAHPEEWEPHERHLGMRKFTQVYDPWTLLALVLHGPERMTTEKWLHYTRVMSNAVPRA